MYCLKEKGAKMAIFGPKPWVNPLEKCKFPDFSEVFFYSLESNFLVLEYHKKHFPGLFWLKKKLVKMAIFGPKPWLTPLEKIMSIFRLFGLIFFIV